MEGTGFVYLALFFLHFWLLFLYTLRLLFLLLLNGGFFLLFHFRLNFRRRQGYRSLFVGFLCLFCYSGRNQSVRVVEGDPVLRKDVVRKRSEGEGIVGSQDKFCVVFDLVVDHGLGMDSKLAHRWTSSVYLDVVVVVHLLSQLLENHLAEGVNSLGDVDIDNDLLPLRRKEGFHYYDYRFCYVFL
jgi:hypothetical protein